MLSGAQTPELEVLLVKIPLVVKCCFKRPGDLSPGDGKGHVVEKHRNIWQ